MRFAALAVCYHESAKGASARQLGPRLRAKEFQIHSDFHLAEHPIVLRLNAALVRGGLAGALLALDQEEDANSCAGEDHDDDGHRDGGVLAPGLLLAEAVLLLLVPPVLALVHALQLLGLLVLGVLLLLAGGDAGDAVAVQLELQRAETDAVCEADLNVVLVRGTTLARRIFAWDNATVFGGYERGVACADALTVFGGDLVGRAGLNTLALGDAEDVAGGTFVYALCIFTVILPIEFLILFVLCIKFDACCANSISIIVCWSLLWAGRYAVPLNILLILLDLLNEELHIFGTLVVGQALLGRLVNNGVSLIIAASEVYALCFGVKMEVLRVLAGVDAGVLIFGEVVFLDRYRFALTDSECNSFVAIFLSAVLC